MAHVRHRRQKRVLEVSVEHRDTEFSEPAPKLVRLAQDSDREPHATVGPTPSECERRPVHTIDLDSVDRDGSAATSLSRQADSFQSHGLSVWRTSPPKVALCPPSQAAFPVRPPVSDNIMNELSSSGTVTVGIMCQATRFLPHEHERISKAERVVDFSETEKNGYTSRDVQSVKSVSQERHQESSRSALSIPTTSSLHLSHAELTLREVTNELSSVVNKSHQIGVQLGVSEATLLKIEADYHNADRRFSAVISSWIKKNTPVPVTWKSLVKVLESRFVNERGLAKELRKKCGMEVTDSPAETDSAILSYMSENSSESVGDPTKAVLTLREVTNELSSVVNKSHQIGVQLGVSEATLLKIEADYHNADRRFSAVISSWIKKNTPVPVTWKSLVEALESRFVNEQGLAKELRKKCGMEVTDSPAETGTGPFELLKNELVNRYKKENWSTSISSGRKVQVDRFVKLALVKKANLNGKEKATDELYRSTVHGLEDDIEKKKKLVNVENLFSKKKGVVEKLLVDGAPGIGKTKLAKYLCTKWAKGKLLKKYKLVVYVQLRRFQTNKLCFLDLIRPYLIGKKGEDVEKQLADTGYSDTLLILDGWDELDSQLRQNFSYFHDIVTGDSSEFKNVSVMVTSRCTVSHQLSDHVDNHVEVLGFDTEQVKEYISACVPDKKELVLSHFKNFPNIQALSHIPMTLSIICSIVQRSNTLPSTLTQLYDLYIRNILLINLKKHKEYCEITGLSSLSASDLPREVFQLVQSLACLAWKGLVEDCLVFENKHFEDTEVNIKVQPGFDAYGLLTLQEYDDGAGVSYLYQFYHLTVQEYLAAWYVEKLNHKQRINLLCQHRLDRKYRMVWKFLSGLTKLSDERIRDAIISATKPKNNRDVALLLHCVYEANNPSVCSAAATHLHRELNLDNMSLNPTDCLCLAFTLANAGGKWALNLRGCNMSSIGLDVLCSNLLWQQKSSKCGQISFKKLDLTHNLLDLETTQLGIANVANLLSDQFNIEDLDFDSNAFGDEKIAVLAQAMCSNKTITSLSFLSCEITHVGAKDLANMLVHNKCLKSLSLRWNEIGDNGAEHFAEALKTNSTLTQLQLGNNEIKDHGFKHLCEMLKVNRGLKELRLELVNIGLQQCRHILDFLPHNRHLELLDLTKSGIGDDGLKILVDGIRKNPSTNLRRFCFFGCGITNEGVKVLCNLIADGMLGGLQLGCNPAITDASVASLSEALENNRTLKSLRLEKCGISEAGQAELQRFSHVDVTFIANVHLDRKLQGIETDSRGLIVGQNHGSY